MALDLSTVVVTGIAVAGTLLATVLGNVLAGRSRREEFDMRAAERTAENRVAEGKAAFLELRTCFISRNRAVRDYAASLGSYLYQLERPEGPAASDDQSLSAARSSYRSAYSEAQMIIPTRLLPRALLVNRGLANVYGIARRLVEGAVKPDDSIPTARSLLDNVWSDAAGFRLDMRTELAALPGVGNRSWLEGDSTQSHR